MKIKYDRSEYWETTNPVCTNRHLRAAHRESSISRNRTHDSSTGYSLSVSPALPAPVHYRTTTVSSPSRTHSATRPQTHLVVVSARAACALDDAIVIKPRGSLGTVIEAHLGGGVLEAHLGADQAMSSSACASK